MALIDYTNKWFEGEIFEDYAIMIAGLLMLVVVGLLWRFATADVTRALCLPLLCVALLHTTGGLALAINNRQRMEQFAQQAKEQSEAEFVQSEKARVEGFMAIYPQVVIVVAVLFAVALVLFAFSSVLWVRAAAVALIYLAFSALVIDYFSKERAVIYQQELHNYSVEKGE